MKNDPLVAKLYNKMQQEQNEYRAWLLAQPPEEILNHAYEYSSREDILIALENASLRPAQLRALLESQAPLADIYKDYRDCDTNTLDVMTLCIADRADIDLMESTKKNWPPVYYQTGRYAREHEELPQYRASMKLNEECRDEIDDAISYNYNGLCLDLVESQDQVAKGNVEISKIVSSSGQSNGLELEGAGFTFFLVSDLSKLKQFEQTRSGSYTLQSILDAYIDKTYDNEHPKWDFSAETQAIAKTYEVNADEIVAYNKTLTAAGENKNGYYVNEEPMEVTFTYDGQTVRILESTCTDKPAEMWVSKRDLTNDEELPGATLTIQDMDGNIVESWVSTDTPHRVTGLHLGDAYTLTETRPADGYALADEITFRLLQKVDEDGSNLQEAEAYYLTKKSLLFWTWDDWKLLDDATVIMRDDTIKAEFSKKDLTTMEELPGAELTITDKDGKEIDRWVSSDKPHYIEKLPAGDYTLTEVKAPDGYAFAESVPFTALPTGEVQQFEIRTKGQSIGKGSHGSSSDSYQVTGRELMTPDEVRRMKRSDCLVMISGEAPVRDKKYNLFDHPNLKYTPDYRSPRGLLHRAATPIPAPEGYTMPPDYMAQAGTVSLAYVAELTCPEITEDLYDELQEWEESLL